VPVRARNSAWPKSHGGSTVAEMWQPSCPALGWMWLEIWVKLLQTEIRDSAPSNRNCWRAPPERGRNAGGKRPPGCFSSARKGGGVEQEPDPHTNHSRNFRLEDPPQFFGQIFWEKILEIKIVLLASPRRGCYASSRSDSAAIGVVLHRWSLSSSRPTPQRLLPRPPASLRYILHAGWPAMPRLPANHP
jgi:hypothetical protein